MIETLEGLSFMLLFKLKVPVTTSFSAAPGTWRASAQDAIKSSATREAEASLARSLRNVWAKNRPTGVNERSFVKKVRSWKSQSNNIRMFEHSLQLYCPHHSVYHVLLILTKRNYAQGKTDTETIFIVTVGFTTNSSIIRQLWKIGYIFTAIPVIL